MATRVTVLLAEGHLQLADALRDFLEGQRGIECLGYAEDGEQLRTFLTYNTEVPDVILIDEDMDVKEDFRLTRWLTVNAPACRLIALVAKEDLYVLQRMAASGVQHFISKETSVADLADKILAVASEERVYTRSIPMYMMDVGSEIGVPVPSGASHTLVHREREVLKMIVNQHSSREIREELGIDEQDLHHIVLSLNEKTDATGSLGLRRYALRHSIY